MTALTAECYGGPWDGEQRTFHDKRIIVRAHELPAVTATPAPLAEVGRYVYATVERVGTCWFWRHAS